MIYLDYNATAPLLPAVRDAMREHENLPLNPSSVHKSGRLAQKLIEDARRTIAAAISVFPHEIKFVGSATEANNTVLRSFAGQRSLLVSAIEHASVQKPAAMLGSAIIPVDVNGLLDLAALEAQLIALGEHKALISVMLANNETGVIQPIVEIAKIAHAHGALLHVDAVQALGKIPIDCGLLGVDMLTLCAHKAGGPVGAAALVLRSGVEIKPFLLGGGQEISQRAGTENVLAIIGMAALMQQVAHCPQAPQWQQMRDDLVQQIRAIAPDAKVFGEAAPRLPNTLLLTMPGVSSETQLMHFDLAGIAVSAGSACSSGRIASSHVLTAMGVLTAIAANALRVSLGWQTTPADIESFVQQWAKLYQRNQA